jgi:hypothetical protein
MEENKNENDTKETIILKKAASYPSVILNEAGKTAYIIRIANRFNLINLYIKI